MRFWTTSACSGPRLGAGAGRDIPAGVRGGPGAALSPVDPGAPADGGRHDVGRAGDDLRPDRLLGRWAVPPVPTVRRPRRAGAPVRVRELLVRALTSPSAPWNGSRSAPGRVPSAGGRRAVLHDRGGRRRAPRAARAAEPDPGGPGHHPPLGR